MPLPLPRLDNRTFDQLVAEGLAIVARSAPEWTDYNAHDPGVTLLELQAWLTEMGLYRLDRIPAASVHAFLRLAGIELQSATAAETVVGVVLSPPGPIAVVARGSRVESADGAVRFQTLQDTSVTAARLVALLTVHRGSLIDRFTERLANAAAFAPFESPDSALYVGFDGALEPTAAPMSLYVSTGLDAQDRETRARLLSEWQSIQINAHDAFHMGAPPSGPGDRTHYRARVAWEYHTGGGQWAPLADVDDETRALTLSGLVRFSVPVLPVHVAGGVAAEGQGNRFFVRCRLSSGGYDCPPHVHFILPHAIRTRHAVDIETVKVRTHRSTGGAAQLFSLGDKPIVPGSTEVKVTVRGVSDVEWQEAANWDRSGPRDRAFVVTHDRGDILFGDGRTGRVPPAGADIRATCQVGGGITGNVAAGTLSRLAGTTHQVVQPLDAAGGAPAEELDEAIGRALTALAAPTRAVTLVDVEALARSVPGAPVARAHAIADYDPRLSCLPVAGGLTVVILPPCPPARPEPTPELLCAVAEYLDRRRLVTTELHVVGPVYKVVSVRARLHPLADVNAAELGAIARAALDCFLDPLRGGADGGGWPIGRDVYPSEVMALLNDLPGVSFVDQVVLQADGGPGDHCGNVPMCPHGLVASGLHQITIESGSRCP